jgi:hypothetical protein
MKILYAHSSYIDDEGSSTADVVIDSNETAPIDTGILNKDGIVILRMPDTVKFGFQV